MPKRFDHFAGRLFRGLNAFGASSKGSNGNDPKKLTPVIPKESKIIYETEGVKFPKVENTYYKVMPGSSPASSGRINPAFRAKQIKFQVDDGVPVHLKGGKSDVLLYNFTLVCLAIGVEESFRFLWRQSFPRKGKC